MQKTLTPQPPYKILYILGSGHSGSTLIDMIIGSNPEAISLGELAYYEVYLHKLPHPKMALQNGYTCTCGEEFTKCPFWKNVNSKFMNISRPTHPYTLKESLTIMINIIFNKSYQNNTISTKSTETIDFYDKIHESSLTTKPKVKILIDSSKDPRRLYQLLNSSLDLRENIKVLYLLRDGRAYINSYKKPYRQTAGLKCQTMLKSILEWIIIQYFSQKLINNTMIPTLYMNYHAFATNQTKHLRRLSSFLEIQISSKESATLMAVHKNTYHNVFGNPNRTNNIQKIKEDTSWKQDLSIFQKTISSIILYPFHKKWLKTT